MKTSMRNQCLVFCMFSIFISCNNNEVSFKSLIENKNLIKLSINSISDNPSIEIDSLIDSIYYIKPQVSDNSLIGEYSKILFEDNKVFILENSKTNKAVYAFAMDGKFLFNINARGDGPGEYVSIHDFYVDANNKQVGILDRSQILKYDYKGKFIGKLDLRKYLVKNIIYNNNFIYAYTYSYCFENKCHNLKVFNMQGELVYSDYPLEKSLQDFPLASDKIYLNADSDKVFFNSLNNDTIYRFEKDHLTPEVVVDFAEYKYPDDEFHKLLDKGEDVISELSYLRDSKYALFGINNFSLTSDYLFTSFLKGYTVYYALFSFKTKNKRIFSSLKPSDNILITPRIIFANDHFIYSILDAEYLDWHKRHEESLGITDPHKDFSKTRIDRYNYLLKDINIDDNAVIAVMKFKYF